MSCSPTATPETSAVTMTFLNDFHVISLCSNSTSTNAARAMRPILPGLAVTCWSVFPLRQQRETALAQAPHRADQPVPGPGINVEFPAPGGLLHRDVDAVTSSFVPGIGQHRHGIAERPQHAHDVLPGCGQVMHIARQHVRNPRRDPGRIEQRRDVPAEIMGLPQVPQVDRLSLATRGFLPAPRVPRPSDLRSCPSVCPDLRYAAFVRLVLAGNVNNIITFILRMK